MEYSIYRYKLKGMRARNPEREEKFLIHICDAIMTAKKNRRLIRHGMPPMREYLIV